MNCLLLAVCLFLAACREKPWDPEIAVLVNGQVIEKKALDQILELGFNPTVTEAGSKDAVQDAPDLNLRQILDNLINERLILEEAAKAGLTISEQELTGTLDAYGAAWFGEKPPPAELAEMREALHKQLLLRKMTERVIEERIILSADAWRVFWAGWPKTHSVRYRVRLLLIPPVKDVPKIPAPRRKDLGEMVEYLAGEGLDVLVEGPIWTGTERVSPEEAKAIEAAFEAKQATLPFRHPESWIVYEPLEIDRGLDEVAELVRAKTAFEELEGEKVFCAWLETVRQGADIQINPAFLELAEVQE